MVWNRCPWWEGLDKAYPNPYKKAALLLQDIRIEEIGKPQGDKASLHSLQQTLTADKGNNLCATDGKKIHDKMVRMRAFLDPGSPQGVQQPKQAPHQPPPRSSHGYGHGYYSKRKETVSLPVSHQQLQQAWYPAVDRTNPAAAPVTKRDHATTIRLAHPIAPGKQPGLNSIQLKARCNGVLQRAIGLGEEILDGKIRKTCSEVDGWQFRYNQHVARNRKRRLNDGPTGRRDAWKADIPHQGHPDFHPF